MNNIDDKYLAIRFAKKKSKKEDKHSNSYKSIKITIDSGKVYWDIGISNCRSK